MGRSIPSTLRTAGLAQFLLALILLDVISARPASACAADPNAALQDDFKTPTRRWSVDGHTARFYEGKLVLSPESNSSKTLVAETPLFRDAIICLDVETPWNLDASPSTSAGAHVLAGFSRFQPKIAHSVP